MARCLQHLCGHKDTHTHTRWGRYSSSRTQAGKCPHTFERRGGVGSKGRPGSSSMLESRWSRLARCFLSSILLFFCPAVEGKKAGCVYLSASIHTVTCKETTSAITADTSSADSGNTSLLLLHVYIRYTHIHPPTHFFPPPPLIQIYHKTRSQIARFLRIYIIVFIHSDFYVVIRHGL